MTTPAKATDRRTLLKVTGAGGAAYLFSSALGASPASAVSPKRRAYVLVIDGCRPGELDNGLMPTVRALRQAGRNFPRASSLPIMETIPNHVMMMTGVRPDRNGVPANSVYDRDERAVRELDRSDDLHYPTVIERLNSSGRSTGTVLSKEYLFGIFGTRATHRWEPKPIVPFSDHAPDQFTTDAAIELVRTFDPNLVVVNLGDCDRVGHADLTGTTLMVARQAALVSADTQIKRFVDLLRSTGRWEHSLLVVLADHSMDFSLPDHLVTLTPALEADPLLAGRDEVAQNGGANLLYWTGPASQRATAVRRMCAVANGVDGVLAAHDREATGVLRLGARAGDVVVYCRAGWRFSDPTPVSNPIPGNHGHPGTTPIPFFLSGGHPVVPPRTVSPVHATTVDVAPTLGRFFGLGRPPGGYDGLARL